VGRPRPRGAIDGRARPGLRAHQDLRP
jgi:hypothetical protein